MAVTNLKEKLYKKLENINDDVLIQDVLNFINIESAEKELVEFSKEQLKLIDEAKQSVRISSVPNQLVFEKTREWLKR